MCLCVKWAKTERKKASQADPELRAKLVSGGWKQFFGRLDANGDGMIDFDE